MEAFDHLLSGSVSEYLRTSTAIGGDVAKHVSASICECQCRFYKETARNSVILLRALSLWY